MIKPKNKKKKICSRGHEYEGSGSCPQCWPGFHERKINFRDKKM